MKISHFTRAVLASLIVLGMTGTIALAHEQRSVGKYNIEVGFVNEPPVDGMMNGVNINITTSVNGADTPVEGLEKTLKVEITHVSTGIKKEFDLDPIDESPGVYTHAMILTGSGAYSFRFFGTIEGTRFNETFTSSASGGLEDVAPASDIQFPETVATPQETETVVRRLDSQVQSLQNTANRANIFGIVGTALGALGVVSAFAIRASKRKAD